MSKKGKGKKGKGAGVVDNTPKFVPMPRTWPGKLSDPDLFSKFATDIRGKLSSPGPYHDYVTLRVQQVDWSFHDFLITLPKSAPLYRLKREIAELQHRGSIHPYDVVIYKKVELKDDTVKTEETFEQKPLGGLGGLDKPKPQKTDELTIEDVRNGRLIPLVDETLSLSTCLPEVNDFVLPVKANQMYSSDHDSEDDEQKAASKSLSATTSAVARPVSAASNKRRSSKVSRRSQSASTNRSVDLVEISLPPPPKLGQESFTLLQKSKPVVDTPFEPKTRPYTAPLSGTRYKFGAQFADVDLNPENAIVVYYDVGSYINTRSNVPETNNAFFTIDTNSPLLLRERSGPSRRKYEFHSTLSKDHDPLGIMKIAHEAAPKWSKIPLRALTTMKHLADKSRSLVKTRARNNSLLFASTASPLVKSIDNVTKSIRKEVDKSSHLVING